MQYIGSSEVVSWLQVLFFYSIAQWFIVAYFLFRNKDKLFFKIKGYSNGISFSKDTFYVYWNLYPIILYILFSNINNSFQYFRLNLDVITEGYSQILYKILFSSRNMQYVDLAVLFVSIIVAYYGAFVIQSKKQLYYMKNKDKIYWWDLRLSKELYWIRLIFLFFNLILISFLVYMMTKLAIFIILILHHPENIQINPFHPDGYGGLGHILEFSSIIILVYLFRSTMGIKGLIDHQDFESKAQFFGDIYHAFHIILSLLFLFFVVKEVGTLFENQDIQTLFNSPYYNKFMEDIKGLHTNQSEVNNFIGYYSSLERFTSSSVLNKLFSTTFFTIFYSFVIWFFKKEIISLAEKFYSEKVNNDSTK